METNPKLLECLFGYHNYGDKPTRDRDGNDVKLCRACLKHGYFMFTDGFTIWFEYNERGECIHRKYSNGQEDWLDCREEV